MVWLARTRGMAACALRRWDRCEGVSFLRQGGGQAVTPKEHRQNTDILKHALKVLEAAGFLPHDAGRIIMRLRAAIVKAKAQEAR